MLQRAKLIIAIAILTLTAVAFAQPTDNIDGRTRWEASVFAGVLTGDHLSTVIINGERATNDIETALMTGVRISAEQEFLGLECLAVSHNAHDVLRLGVTSDRHNENATSIGKLFL